MESAGAAADAAGNTGAVGDASKSREDRLSALLDDGEDLLIGGEDEEEDVSPPSLSPRSLRALQQRVKGARGVDPNIVGSSGGIW
jgi:hypothetical protein